MRASLFIVDHHLPITSIVCPALAAQYQCIVANTEMHIWAHIVEKRRCIIFLDLQAHIGDGSYTYLRQLIIREHRVIVLSRHTDEPLQRACYYMGVAGFLAYSCSAEEIQQTLASVERGELAFAADLLHSLQQDSASMLPIMRKNEKVVLSHLMDTPTPSNPEIAAALNVSFQHIKNLVNQLCAKFAVHNRNDLVRAAKQRGFVAHAYMPRLRLHQRKYNTA